MGQNRSGVRLVDVAASKFKNALLRALDPEAIARLSLRWINFEIGHELEYPGTPIENLFFVEEGMASITNTFDDGSPGGGGDVRP